MLTLHIKYLQKNQNHLKKPFIFTARRAQSQILYYLALIIPLYISLSFSFYFPIPVPSSVPIYSLHISQSSLPVPSSQFPSILSIFPNPPSQFPVPIYFLHISQSFSQLPCFPSDPNPIHPCFPSIVHLFSSI
ncbi:hypothetical protein BDZ91DRAFT_743072 [Kalaharituber pfeilii]|nr:hypothetical protein BDZ91DRAFT_743072 [Kalaharituber pfeilii]